MQNIVFKIKRDGLDYERKGFTHIDEEYLYFPKKKDSSIEYELWDCIRYCHPIIGRPNQFKGYYKTILLYFFTIHFLLCAMLLNPFCV